MAPASPLQHMVAVNGHPTPSHPPKKAVMDPNVMNVVLGDLQIKPWYPSFYPEEVIAKRAEILYVCDRCFKYSKEVMPYLGHMVRIGCLRIWGVAANVGTRERKHVRQTTRQYQAR